MHDRIGASRGWQAFTHDAFVRQIEAGSLYVGSAEMVARKIARTVCALGPSRFQLKYSAGTLRHGEMMDAIERYGREVAPMVRDLLARRERVADAA